MAYVDGFVIAMPKKNLPAYRRMAKLGCRVWMDHGALDYRECTGDDLKIPGLTSFLDQMQAKKTETIVFAWITFKSRRHRDQVNAKVMKDPRMKPPKTMPFEMHRMLYGGFQQIVGP